MTRRFLFRALAALLLLAVVGVLGYRWYRSTRPAERLRQGIEAVQQGDLVAAEALAEALKSSGYESHWALLKAEVAYRRNEPAEAMSFLNHIDPAVESIQLPAAVLMARCLISLQRTREAESVLKFALSLDPACTDAHRWLGVIYYDQGNIIRAIDHLNQVAELDQADDRSLRLVGLINRDLNRWAEAVDAYQRSLQRNPHPKDEAAVRSELAQSLLRLAQPAEALQHLEGLSGPEVSTSRAEALLALGRDAEAIEVMDAALRQGDDDVGLLRMRAERHLVDGNLTAAGELLERALARHPSDLTCLSAMIRVREAQGQADEADRYSKQLKKTQDLLEQGSKLADEAMTDPWNSAVRLKLADIFDQLGRKEDARMWRRAADACKMGP